MQRISLPFFMVLALALPVLSQIPAPSPTPPIDNDVVKISTNLIRLDVSVTDSKGKSIADLKHSEIEVYENGEKQRITGLRFVSAAPKAEPTRADPKNSIPIPQAQLRPEQIRRTIALVVDDITLSFESAYQTRRALKKFVDEQMEDGDLVAIIRTGAGIGALQQFTSDKRILNAAIEKVRWNPLGNGGLSSFAPIQSRLPQDENASETEVGERTAEGGDREFEDFRQDYFATGTLGAIEYIVRGMRELPGRKSAILFSDGFELTNVNAEGFTELSGAIDPIRRLIEQANRASVVIYAMDPRGLVYAGITAADDVRGRSNEQVQSELSGRSQRLSETQQSLRYISQETGGFALTNNNDLSGGVRRVLEDQSYYLVSYEPDDDTFDPVKRRFNRLEVRVLREGATARYRSGFFNIVDRENPTTVSSNSIGSLEYALVSPFSVVGIDVRLNALFGNEAKKLPYVRSLLHVDASDLSFIDSDHGQKKATFEVLAISFGDNGQPVDKLARTYTLSVRPDVYKKILSEGFVYHFLFPVKKPGPYQYRVAIRDSITGKLGSASQFVDVPDLKKKRLTLSSLVLENLSETAWKNAASTSIVPYESNPITDTALRRVKVGTILRVGLEVYNARIDKDKIPRLFSRIRVFSEGKVVLDGKQTPIELLGQTDLQQIRVARALSLGDKMLPGDYVLQVIVTDAVDPKKERMASQAIQFELVP